MRAGVALLAVGVAAGVTAWSSATAQPGGAGQAPALPSADGLSPAALQSKISPRLGAEQGPVTVFVELAQQPAVDTFTEERREGASAPAAADAAEDQRAETERAADRVLNTLRARDAGTDELYVTSNAVAGVAVTADAASVRALATSPDVVSVRKVVPKTLDNSSAVQLTRTLQVWRQTGNYGDGIRVGIIDDGIDYTHSNFGGRGTPEAYAAVDRDTVNPAIFPTAKVIGGYDFAGDDYDASGGSGPENLIPEPDPNPISCGTHGTHVAGTAGGFGVNADGSTFRGNYRQLNANRVNQMRIGPGTAPNSLLYSLKVFGCNGSTNVTAQALDWALDPDGDGDYSDRLDVVNLSLGSNFGAPDDPDSLFVRKLAQNGVLPVFSAGNGGDLFDVGGSPGNTPEALTVASTRDSYVLRDGAEVTGPSGVAGVKGGQYSQDYASFATLDLTGPVVPLTVASNLDGCQPYSSADAARVRGKHVWLEWDDNDATRRCGSVARANNAQAAGAAGVVMSSQLDQFAGGLAGNAAVPMFQFTRTDTEALRPALQAGTLVVRLAGNLRSSVRTNDPSLTDTPSDFTSRSVRGPAVKPDVAAPGDTIASSLSGSGSGTLVISGTSMASPHVAGIGALVRQAHPDWSVEEVKAAVINTAGADVYSQPNKQGPVLAPNRVGAGRVDGLDAVQNQVLAMVENDPGQVSANFGVVEVAGPTTLTKTIKVVNKGTNTVTYDASYRAITSIPGVSYSLSANQVRVNPRGVGRLTLTLRITDPTALRKVADPTLETNQLDVARQFLADASGLVLLRPANGATTTLRLPVYSAPKPVADIAGPASVRFRGTDTQSVLNLTGRGVNQGTGAQAFRSLVSVLQYGTESPQLPVCGDALVVDCTINETAKGADIRYVGAASTAPLAVAQGAPQDALLAFGVSTWGDWYNLGSNTIPFVDFDVTGDGVPDFETYATKLTGTDVLVAVTVNLNAPGFPTVDIQPVNGQFGDVDTNVFDTNVVVLPVSHAALGVNPAAGSAPITYVAGTSGFYTGPGDTDGVVDTTAPVRFDANKPGLSAQGGGDAAVSYLARPGTSLVVNRDAAAAAAQGADRLLLLHHHNAEGDRTQVVRVQAPATAQAPANQAPAQQQPAPAQPAPAQSEPASGPAAVTRPGDSQPVSPRN